ncbi:reverse transcriptase domain-containing protein [Deinococcus aquiradiocola]|uniref:Reverse transcriptase domain-containing protein n=1 Tax=Deinococcus aquiradiocola TaxID=393059 RepID=A0A917UR80_9DEIO|nr:reverse transcriptase domain-containing protein [Deinococcus aquiradiocola]GGJ78916.1 hypothetical protein GCM10008939_23450 [Deinococcus aquiradiocola]
MTNVPPDRPPVALLTLDRAVTLHHLRVAWQATAARAPRPGPDGETVQLWSIDAETRLQRLLLDVHSGRYRPRAAWRVWVPREHGPPRGVVALSVADRVVEGAVLSGLRGTLEAQLPPTAYAYRPGHGALQAVQAILQSGQRQPWAVRGDVEQCFDSIPHDGLLTAMSAVLDAPLLTLLRALLSRPVVERGLTVRTERGVPQGSLLAPLLANWYLRPFDAAVTVAGGTLVRYADDFVIASGTPAEAGQLAGVAAQALAQLDLRLNAGKTRIVSVQEGYEFLGFQFRAGDVRIAPRRLDDFRAQVQGTLGVDVAVPVDDARLRAVNDLIRGWQAYFRLGSVHEDHRALDTWLAETYPHLRSRLARFSPGVVGRSVTPAPGQYTVRPAASRSAARPAPTPLPALTRAALQELAHVTSALAHPAYRAAAQVAAREQAGAVNAGSTLIAVQAAHRTVWGPHAPGVRQAALQLLVQEAQDALAGAGLSRPVSVALAPALADLLAPRTLDAHLGDLTSSGWPVPLAFTRRLDASLGGPLTARVLLHREAFTLARASLEGRTYVPWRRP